MLCNKGSKKTSLSSASCALVLLASAALVGSCQVRPLNRVAPLNQEQFQKLVISPAKNTVEQTVRNQLIFLTRGANAAPVHPNFRLDMNVQVSTTSVLGRLGSQSPHPIRVVVSGPFVLKDIRTNKVILSKTFSAISLVDYSGQEFAKNRTIQNAKNNAAKQLAEFVYAGIILALEK